ncbi:MAG TPA: NADAR family protein [Bacteroidia bacterium]|nr:NADAR family protein [Bacteroidia bacterium]
MKYSINWLQNQIQNNSTFDYLCFWGHTPKKPNQVDKSCFSQWYPSPFTVEDTLYHTAEHWMMAKKAMFFDDTEALEKILSSPKPGNTKAIGREVKNFDYKKWDSESYKIVVEGNYHKFLEDNVLKEYLLSTGSKILVEASPVDIIWGIGLAQDDLDALDPLKWKGTNLLGFALMEVRDYLNS